MTENLETREGLLCVLSGSVICPEAELLRTYFSGLGKIHFLSQNLYLKNAHSPCTQRSSGRKQSSGHSCSFRARIPKHM